MANNTSNYIYFDRLWFQAIKENGYDIENYYTYCMLSCEIYSKKIKERNKAKKNSENGEIIPDIFDKDNTSYMKIPRLHIISEPENKAQLMTMMIAQYIYAHCKSTSKEDLTKYIKFSTLEKVFGLTEVQIGQLITKYGEDYYLSIKSKQERVTRPKKIYYANFQTKEFYDEFKALDLQIKDEEEVEEFTGDIDWI